MNLKESIKRKIKAVQKIIRDKNLDGVFLDGFKENPYYKYITQSDLIGYLIITKSSNKFYISKMELNRAYKLYKRNDIFNIEEFDIDVINKKMKGRWGAVLNKISYNSYKRLKKSIKMVDISSELDELRAIKDKYEINVIKEAMRISKKALLNTLLNFNNLKTENDLKAYLNYQIYKLGGEPAFDTIVANSNNSLIPHHKSTNKKLKRGFVLIDFGVKYKCYNTDITRMIQIGRLNLEESKFFFYIFDLQKKIIENIKPGIKIKDLCKHIKYNMIHSLGHGIGIEVHEKPTISFNSDNVLKKGMVIAIEPGWYYKYGIRIEDNILVDDKPVVLSKGIPKIPLIVPNLDEILRSLFK